MFYLDLASNMDIKGLAALMTAAVGMYVLAVVYCGFAVNFPSIFPGGGVCGVVLP
jgi:glucose uptake protein GlcU